MEKIVFLLVPDHENLIEILKKIAFDLGLFVVFYNWFKKVKLLLFGTNAKNGKQKFRENITQMLQLLHLLSIKNNRVILKHHIQKRIVIAADNFF